MHQGLQTMAVFDSCTATNIILFTF